MCVMLLPDFDGMRTPQWVARAEFYPYQPLLPGHTAWYRNEVQPRQFMGNETQRNSPPERAISYCNPNTD